MYKSVLNKCLISESSLVVMSLIPILFYCIFSLVVLLVAWVKNGIQYHSDAAVVHSSALLTVPH